MPYERTITYSIGSLVGSVFLVGGRFVPRLLAGRSTVIEREVIAQLLKFFSETVPASALTSFAYGVAATYTVVAGTSSLEAFEVLVLPRLGGTFVNYLIPFAVANLVLLKGVVGMTSDIASMRVSQEIDALESVGLDPAQMVFAPRAIALIITAPALAVLGIYAACLGSWLVVWMVAGTELTEFTAAFASSIASGTLWTVVAKLAVTAVAMSIISGYFGFVGAKAEQGFVGRITTSAVSAAGVAVIIVNFLLSLLTAAFRLG